MSNPPPPMSAELAAKQKALAEICNERSYPITSSIQPIGLMFVVDRDFIIHKASANIDVLGLDVGKVLGSNFLALLAPEHCDAFRDSISFLLDESVDARSEQMFYEWRWNDTASGAKAEGFVYRSSSWLCIEAELPNAEEASADQFAIEAQAMREIALFNGGLDAFADLLTHWIRRIIGFDRVYCFQFDAKKNGVVIGESRNNNFPTMHDHHFPATDIPSNLHEIYKRSRFRFLADRNCTLVPLLEEAGPSAPLDLSLSVVRQIAPSHLVYLENMGVVSTISFSIVIDDRLWGLLGGHNASPKHLPFRTLVKVQQLVEMFASKAQSIIEISDKKRLKQRLDHILKLTRAYEDAACSFTDFIVDHKRALLDLVGGDDLMWIEGDTIHPCDTISQTDAEAAMALIGARTLQQAVFATSCLSEENPAFAGIGTHVAGVLAVAISDYEILVWVRKEEIQQRKWGGNPNEPLQLNDDGKVGPRHSFATWVQQVRFTAKPWETADVRAAEQLRLALMGVKAARANMLLSQNRVLQEEIEERKRVEQALLDATASLRETNKQLESFAYVASHDLQEPLRMVASYAQLLEKHYGHQLDAQAQKYLSYAVNGAKQMHMLIDSILDYSRLDKKTQKHELVRLDDVLKEVVNSFAATISQSGAVVEYASLPAVMAERTQIYQLFQNLLSNAFKFSKPDTAPKIEISAKVEGKFWCLCVKDNGIGIRKDMQEKVFEMFQRLRPRAHDGNGIGLALCRRIVELHGGRMWCESDEDAGASFFFTLPVYEGAV